MTRKQIIQEMQMCSECSPYFERRDGHILAHQIGMHVKVWQDGYTDVNGKRVEFQNESCYGKKERSILGADRLPTSSKMK